MTQSTKTPDRTRPTAVEDTGRRDFLMTAGGLAATGALLRPASLAQAAADPAGTATRAAGVAAPFQLGVASGDPLPDSVVIWTRLVADPLAPGGGMPERPVTVDWEVAGDPALREWVMREDYLEYGLPDGWRAYRSGKD